MIEQNTWINEDGLVALYELAINIAIDSNEPKDVLFNLGNGIADQTLPMPCSKCNGLGWLLMPDGLEHECDDCNCNGTQQAVIYPYSDSMTVYEWMLLHGGSITSD